MVDPFALALNALFYAPGSSEAVYQPAGGLPVPVRVVRSAPDRETRFGGGRVLDNAGTILELRRSDVPNPADGDTVLIGDETFRLFGDPVLDLERIGWTCGANLA